MRRNDVLYQGPSYSNRRAGTAERHHSIPDCTESRISFLFFFERDYLFSVLAFESSATSKTRHKIKHPANAVHSRTKPVSASLHAIFLKI